MVIALTALLLAGVCRADRTPQADTRGWRGNWTGLYPDADPPVEWGRIPCGVLAGMTCQAAKPADDAARTGQPVDRGLLRDWLIIGPFNVEDPAKDLAKEQISDEPWLAPSEGDKVGDLAWQRVEVQKKPDYELWGTTELGWVDLGEALGFKPNAIAYAFTYVCAERGGKAVMVVDHGYGMKVWLDGRVVYENADRGQGLGSYVGISRQKKEMVHVLAGTLGRSAVLCLRRPARPRRGDGPGGLGEPRGRVHRLDHPHAHRRHRRHHPPGRRGLSQLGWQDPLD